MWGMLGGKQFPFALYSDADARAEVPGDPARERPDHRGGQRLPPQGCGELTWLEVLRIGYTRLFEVRVLHHFWLDDGATVFDATPTGAGRSAC